MEVTKIYYRDRVQVENPPQAKNFIVFNGNCFEALKNYPDSVLHNFANNSHQGGPTSSFTPEGRLVRCSSWSNTQEDQIVKFYGDKLVLPKSMYPISTTESGEALILSTGAGMPPLITIAAPIGFNRERYCDTMRKRLVLLVETAAKLDKALITGLWGCGAFGGNPYDLIELWDEILSDKTVSKPKTIVFTVIIDTYSKHLDALEILDKLHDIATDFVGYDDDDNDNDDDDNGLSD